MPRHRRGWAFSGHHSSEDRHSQLIISTLEPALLILLRDQPQHGYSLLTELSNLGMSALHPSVVYRTLRDMEDLEWIQSDWDIHETQGPPRRNYRLTEQGRLALNFWQNEMRKTQGIIANLLNRLENTERS